MKVKIFLVLTALFLGLAVSVRAQILPFDDYIITDFASQIEIQKDTSVTISEKIVVNFPNPRHGIYRVIPVVYSNRGRTIKTKLSVLEITDENGQKIM